MREEITGHGNVRAALRDTETYSSDIQGDADVRNYRQIPLEVDPPQHHSYRTALNPLFVRPRIEKLIPQFTEIAKKLLDEFEKNDGDFIQKVALPYVVRCLTVIYNRPDDYEEWMSWGADVWVQTPTGRTGEFLHSYLKRVYDESKPEDDDAWSMVKSIEIDGNVITFKEFLGAGSVMLAGGRDTVVKLNTFSVYHLLNYPEDAAKLLNGTIAIPAAINEFLRFTSPLPGMMRLAPHAKEKPDNQRVEEDFVYINFASGNHDESVFPQPDKVDISREKITHVAFGFGPHTCVGNHIAEIETRILIEQFLPRLSKWKIEKAEVTWQEVNNSKFPGHFESVEISCG